MDSYLFFLMNSCLSRYVDSKALVPASSSDAVPFVDFFYLASSCD